MPSETLGRPLAYSLYLPDGYGIMGRRFPVLYLLHGVEGQENDWLDAARLRQTADWMIALGEVPPLIVVMPDGESSWYVDAPTGAGAMATAIGEELVAYIDVTYATDARPGARAIAGLSMGGFGAMRLALAMPQRYAAAVSISGALFKGDEPVDGPFPGLFHGAFDEPFDRDALVAASPYSRIEDVAGKNQRPAILISCGDDDEFGFAIFAARFHDSLKRAGIQAELRIKDGNHSWPFWAEQLPEVLRFVGTHLQADNRNNR